VETDWPMKNYVRSKRSCYKEFLNRSLHDSVEIERRKSREKKTKEKKEKKKIMIITDIQYMAGQRTILYSARGRKSKYVVLLLA
jgi:hypothetical protein